MTYALLSHRRAGEVTGAESEGMRIRFFHQKKAGQAKHTYTERKDSKELRDRRVECQGRAGYSRVSPHKMRGVVSSLDTRFLGGDLRSVIRTPH